MELFLLIPLVVILGLYVFGGVLRWFVWAVSGKRQGVMKIVGAVYDILCCPIHMALLMGQITILQLSSWVYFLGLFVVVFLLVMDIWELISGIRDMRGREVANHVDRKFCPHCGAEQFNKLNTMCTSCGRDMSSSKVQQETVDTKSMPTWKRVQLAQEKAEAEAKARETCPNCAAPIRQGDVFCDQCGTRLK